MIVIMDKHDRIFSEFGQSHLTGTAFPKFEKPSECHPAQITVFHNMEDAKSLLDLLSARIMDHRMMDMKHSPLRIVDLMDENKSLKKQVEMLEQLRPHWAKGFTDDGRAAQSFSAALSELWKLLGVKDQTAAAAKLRELTKCLPNTK